MTFERAIDVIIEAPVFTSFTRLGYDVRSRLAHWTDLSSYDLTGRVALITGATSGIGLVAAERLAGCGATVVLLGRDRAKTERVRDQLVASSGNEHLDLVIADMADLDAVRTAAADVRRRHARLDVLVHNAGALTASRQVAPSGIELTVAGQVVGPFLLTALLLDRLRQSAPGRVITMSSGGMYTADLEVDDLQMGDGYKGSHQYARAKRAQVTLNEMWAQRVPATEVVFQAMHPGWADTPGVRDALPTFRKLVGPLLRSPEQGADTLVWLAADDGEPIATSGGFWLDRRMRPIHKLHSTKRSDTVEKRNRLWDWCVDASGIDPSTLP
ncbi:MAG: SDR family NAD(P)-dependent oxidoreductase [Ilumatobacteraceae bacterium]